MKKKIIQYTLLAGLFIGGTTSCTKILDKDPVNQLGEKQVYQNVSDADAAVFGLYGKFQGLAERYILLNELRADMIEYTQNADQYMQQLSSHTVTADNPYASPRPFYELILQCNDVIKNFDIMKQQNRMKLVEYNQRYSDVVCLRSFLYLQLGIHYGEVPYVTDPLESVDALKNVSLFPKLPFNTLLDTLIAVSERIPFKDFYPTGTATNPTPNVSVDGYTLANFFINKKCLLGDLNLWKGNYMQAATWYKDVLETYSNDGNAETRARRYKLGWGGTSGNYITYTRPNDATSLVLDGDGWAYMYSRPIDAEFSNEMIWAMPFDNRFAPANPLVKLFSPIGGSYLLKPSQAAIDYWNSQQQRPVGTAPGLPYDARGLLSWKNIGGQPTIFKYLYNYINATSGLPVNALQKDSKWFIYRQTHLHLRYAEATNRTGRTRLAYAFFNQGIPNAYPPPAGITDVTNYQNTLFDIPTFAFAARTGNAPYFRDPWARNIGIRNRASLPNYVLTATSVPDSISQIEMGLLQENALENGFEGTRWPDLVRIALRRNEPAIVADRVYQKLLKDGVPGAAATRAKLMNPANWYLPFTL